MLVRLKLMIKFKNIDIKAHDCRWLEAVDTFQRGDRAGALFLFKRLANEGCAPALIEVGNIYELGGGGVHQDYLKAKEWYLHAVEVIDDVNAHLALGRLYLNTGASKSDFHNAHYHFKLLIDHNNHMGALYGIGLVYELGLGVDKNYSKAEDNYGRAIEQGHILAMKHLAKLRLKKYPVSSFALWMKASIKILKVGYENPYDPRLGIR